MIHTSMRDWCTSKCFCKLTEGEGAGSINTDKVLSHNGLEGYIYAPLLKLKPPCDGGSSLQKKPL